MVLASRLEEDTKVSLLNAASLESIRKNLPDALVALATNNLNHSKIQYEWVDHIAPRLAGSESVRIRIPKEITFSITRFFFDPPLSMKIADRIHCIADEKSATALKASIGQ